MTEKTRRAKYAVKRIGGIGGKRAAESAVLLKVVEILLRFAGGCLLSNAVIFGNYAPFAAGFAAVSGGGPGGAGALVGIAAGAVLRGGVDMAVKYSAIALLVFAVNLVMRGTSASARPWFAPLNAAAMTACTSVVYVANGGWQLREIVLFISEVVLAGGSAYFYRIAFAEAQGREQERRRAISMLAAACTVLIALSDIELVDIISVGRIAAVAAVLIAAGKGGAAYAAAVGVVFGAAMDAAAGTLPFFCAVYGAAGVAAGAVSGGGRLPCAAVYIVVNAAAAVCCGAGRPALAAMGETFIASVAFVLLPEQLLLRIKENLVPGRGSYSGVEKARAYTRNKALQAAEAFSAVYEMLGVPEQDRLDRQDNVSVVFEAAAERRCAACSRRDICHGADYEQTRTAQNDATVGLLLRGKLGCEDFPEYFRDSCIHIDSLCEIINEEYSGLVERRRLLKRAGDAHELLFRRFLDMAEVFAAFAEQLVPAGTAEAELEERLELYLRGKNFDIAPAVFRDGNGRLHIELDGDGAASLKRMPDWLDKLAAVVGKQICEVENEGGRRHISILEAEPLTVRIGVAAMRRSGEETSGDKGAYFKTDSGMLYVILSDGMGSGEEAAEDSEEVISMLERFLKAGIAAECAMRLVGAAMQIKNNRSIASASVDMLAINLFTGDSDIFKFGAAPTLVRNSAGVSIHAGESLSAGLSGADENLPDHIRTRLAPGSTAVIVSDGVTGGENVEWLCFALEKERSAGREFARSVLEEAGKRFGCADDMTVITVNVEKR